MSTDDLERYEAEIELQLYKEYKDVCPMFSYVVETERRFYLANNGRAVGPRERRPDLRRARVARRVGVGHVPPDPLRRVGADRHVQRREHRGASQGRPAAVRPVTKRRLQLGADGETLAAAWYAAHGYELLARNWRCREGEIDLIVQRDRSRGDL